MLKSGVLWLLFGTLLLGSCTSVRKKRADSATDLEAVLSAHEPGGSIGKTPKTTLSFAWPVEGKPRIASFFGWRKKPGRRHPGERMHEGVDLGGHRGDRIHASTEGRVIEVAWVRGYGKTIIIYHGGGWSTLYAHLNKYNVKKGKSVQEGAVIGFMGRTGHAEANHLHFEIRKGADPLDPLLFLPSREVERFAPEN